MHALTLADVVHPDRHAQELGLGPDVSIELDLPADTLRIEGRYWRRGEETRQNYVFPFKHFNDLIMHSAGKLREVLEYRR